MSSRKPSPKGRRHERQPDDKVGLYLSLISRDIDAGHRVRALPKGLADMLKRAAKATPADLDQAVDGDVEF